MPGDSGKANALNAVAQYTIEMMKAPLLRRAALKILIVLYSAFSDTIVCDDEQ